MCRYFDLIYFLSSSLIDLCSLNSILAHQTNTVRDYNFHRYIIYMYYTLPAGLSQMLQLTTCTRKYLTFRELSATKVG